MVVSTVAATLKIRVGLYNSIPDLNGDKLVSYKKMVENEFRQYCLENGVDFEVDAVVDESKYNPYAGKKALEKHLTDGSFDMLEIDTATLRKFCVQLYTGCYFRTIVSVYIMFECVSACVTVHVHMCRDKIIMSACTCTVVPCTT